MARCFWNAFESHTGNGGSAIYGSESAAKKMALHFWSAIEVETGWGYSPMSRVFFFDQPAFKAASAAESRAMGTR